jgi:hypothetical protein
MEQIHRWVVEELTEQVKECNKSWMVFFRVAGCSSLTEALEFKDGKYKELLARFDEKYDTELKSGSEEGKRLKKNQNNAVQRERVKLQTQLDKEKSNFITTHQSKNGIRNGTDYHTNRLTGTNGYRSQHRIGYDGGNNQTRKMKKRNNKTRKN